MRETFWSLGYRAIRRVVVTVVGVSVVLVGIAMLVLPGPAVVVIPAGLGILAMEFAWARRLLEQAKVRSLEAYYDLLGGREGREEREPASEEASRQSPAPVGRPGEEP